MAPSALIDAHATSPPADIRSSARRRAHRTLGQDDPALEQARPILVGDAQRVAKAACRHEQRRLALALEERVGRDGRSHLHRLDLRRRDRRRRRDAEQAADAGDRGVAVLLGVLGKKLQGRERAVGTLGDDIGEGAAAVDPELPARVVALLMTPSCRPAETRGSVVTSCTGNRVAARTASAYGGMLVHSRTISATSGQRATSRSAAATVARSASSRSSSARRRERSRESASRARTLDRCVATRADGAQVFRAQRRSVGGDDADARRPARRASISATSSGSTSRPAPRPRRRARAGTGRESVLVARGRHRLRAHAPRRRTARAARGRARRRRAAAARRARSDNSRKREVAGLPMSPGGRGKRVSKSDAEPRGHGDARRRGAVISRRRPAPALHAAERGLPHRR